MTTQAGPTASRVGSWIRRNGVYALAATAALSGLTAIDHYAIEYTPNTSGASPSRSGPTDEAPEGLK